MTGENSGRISTKTFYEALLKQTEAMGSMELRIVEKINEGIAVQQNHQQSVEARLAEGSVHFKHLENDVKNLKLWDRGLGLLTIIGSAFGIGIRGE